LVFSFYFPTFTLNLKIGGADIDMNATIQTVKNTAERFLQDLKVKMKIWGILYLDRRPKNAQTLLDLEIAPGKRTEIVESLEASDYIEGPKDDVHGAIAPLWVFGKTVKGKELYIKISLGVPESEAICISFHTAEYQLQYPLRN